MPFKFMNPDREGRRGRAAVAALHLFLIAFWGIAPLHSQTPPSLAVPNLAGLTQSAATASIFGAQFKLGTVSTSPSTTAAAGTVIGQSPAAGTMLPMGSAVNIILASASVTVVQGPTTTITGLPGSPPVIITSPTTPGVGATPVFATVAGGVSYGAGTNKGKPANLSYTVIDANYVGPYSLNTKCDSGFFDPIYGGTCWTCPDSDAGGGAYLRGTNAVTDDAACWRVPIETRVAAKYDNPGWSWDCTGNQFWDTHDQNGNLIPWGGSCWECPADHPRRTQYAINSADACATPVQQTAAATLLKYNSCPKPDVSKMYPNRAPNDKRIPDRPFLDIASGLSVANNVGGACWSCPVVDASGNFLTTERNGNTLIGKLTGNMGCNIDYAWTPPVFVEPGMSKLTGVKNVLVEKQVFANPDTLTRYLYGLASVQKMTGAAATAWVSQQWQDIRTHPYQNTIIRALVLQYLLHQAPPTMYPNGTIPATRTMAEQTLAASFQTYIQTRQTYLAQQALDAYTAWKAADDANRASHAQSQVGSLFYFGDAPPNFPGMLTGLMIPAPLGAGVIGAFVAGNNFAQGVQFVTTANGVSAVRNTTLFGMTAADIFSGGAQGAAIIGGAASIIAIIYAVIGGVATSQFSAIVSTLPKLQAALAAAQQPVNLDTFVQGPNGQDMAVTYWALATGVPAEQEDADLLNAANTAYAAASKTNFAQPK